MIVNRLLGAKKRIRLAGMFANFAQIVFGAGLVSYFFKEGTQWMRWIALVFFVIAFIGAIVVEPEEGGR